jgi:flagellar motor switch protein FliM
VSRLTDILMESPVHLTAEVGRVELTVKDLMGLEVGNIISLGKSVSDELVLKIEDIPKYLGTPGVSRGAQAIKITRSV